MLGCWDVMCLGACACVCVVCFACVRPFAIYEFWVLFAVFVGLWVHVLVCLHVCGVVGWWICRRVCLFAFI